MQAEIATTPVKAVKVTFTAGFSRRYTDSIREFEVQAKKHSWRLTRHE